MYGYSYRARLICNGAGDCLPYPPGRVSAEFEAFGVVEFLHRLHKPKVPLLNKVEKQHAPAHVSLGNADHKSQVGFAQKLLRLLVALLHAARQLRFLLR